MSKTAQEIAREALAAQAKETWADEAAAYFNALSEIAALPSSPASAPFALPVSSFESVRVTSVEAVSHSSAVEGGAILTRYREDGVAVDSRNHVRPPYAAAWLSLFGVPEKEASK